MYNPRDYQEKRQQVKRQGRIIAAMSITIVFMFILYAVELKSVWAAQRDQYEYRERMWSAEMDRDSLSHRVELLQESLDNE